MLVFQSQLTQCYKIPITKEFIEQEILHESSSSFYNGNGHSSWEAVSTSHKPLQDTVKVSFYRTRVRSLVMLVSDCLPNSLLTHSCLVNLIDVTLACGDTNSELVDIVTVANVDDEDCIGNSLLQIWELRFGQKAKLLFGL